MFDVRLIKRIEFQIILLGDPNFWGLCVLLLYTIKSSRKRLLFKTENNIHNRFE